MEFKGYFQQEMLALRGLAQDAMKRNPALETFFGTPGRDPDAEKVLESFAFLAARLREKHDDELPEITHGLFSLLWPNYLRPFPATSVIQFHPTKSMTGSTITPKGTLVQSIPVEGTPCTFQTVYDTEVLPLRISDQWFFERNGMHTLAVRFNLTNSTLQALPLSLLRFFFTGNDISAHTLYFTLLKLVREIHFVLRDVQREEHITAVLEHTALRPVGLVENEGLYPYPEHTGLGYRILQEYFSYPEKFLFVEVSGLEKGLGADTVQKFQHAEEFEIHFVLRELPEKYEALRADNWKLFCTPVINLFPFKPSPLKISGQNREYKITPDSRCPDHFSVYSVERVSNWSKSGKKEFEGKNAASFTDHIFQHANTPQYRIHVRPPWSGEDIETFIAIDAEQHEESLLDLDLTCTNHLLPSKLGVGDINSSVEKGSMSALPFTNILPVVAPLPPPLQGDLLWKLLSNMSLNYVSLTDVEAFRAILVSQHFRAMHEHSCSKSLEKTMRGITSIQSTQGDRIFNGIPIRGMRTRITLDSSCFCCEGALYLFGSILNEFLALYATKYSFQQLIVVNSQNEEYQWPARVAGFDRL